MAYAESTVGGSYGGNYRVWVNSIRTWDGGPSDNSEDWRVEGGLNKIGGTSAYNNYNNSSFTVQLGLNGVAASGNFNYNFADGTRGTVLAWGTGATKVYRDSAGVGFGFTSRMDINLQNSPYLTSGWVQSSDSVQTRYRHAVLTAISTDAGGIPFTDEGPAWVEFSNPSGAAVDAWIEINGSRVFTSGSIGSRYNYTFNSTLINAIQAASANSNTYNVRYGIHDSMGGDSWDYRDRTGTIKNDTGQANPTFSNFTYSDTNSTTAAVTGNNQVLIQGKSTLSAVVSTGNKATANKNATMSSYSFTIGGYSQSSAWSSGSTVTKAIGTVSDVSGTQSLAVRAVDSRGNGTTVSKSVTVLPYANPAITPSLTVKYTNDYDTASGLTLTIPSSVIATISPLTLSGTDKNAVNGTSGVKFDLSKGNNSSYTGTKVNVATSRTSGSSNVTTTAATVASSILTKMNAMGADNTVVWYVKFEITDSLGTTTFETPIDIGRSIFRIGADGYLYYKEIEMKEYIGGKLLDGITNATFRHVVTSGELTGETGSTTALIMNFAHGLSYIPAVTKAVVVNAAGNKSFPMPFLLRGNAFYYNGTNAAHGLSISIDSVDATNITVRLAVVSSLGTSWLISNAMSSPGLQFKFWCEHI